MMPLSATQICASVLLPVSGLVLFWLYRRSSKSDEEVYGTHPQNQKKVTTSRSAVIEVSVPQRAVGAVIGRGGARIKEIQKASGARVTFKDRGDGGAGGDGLATTHRVAVIHGALDAAHQAELMIQQVIADIPEPITEMVDVPGYSLGRIIGKGGSSIRELQQSSGARINVERNQEGGPDTLRTITLVGTQQQIDVALELIEEKLQQEEKFRNKVNVMAKNREERKNQPEYKREHIKTKTVNVDTSAWDDGMPSAAVYRQEKLPLTDGYLKVYVSAVEHPEHFWLQVVSSKALHLEKLQTDLTSWVDTKEAQENFAVTSCVPGQLVAAKFEAEDPVYYRAKVLGENEGGALDLYFVDYGDNSFVDMAQVFRLREDFESFPFQAIECALADVKPPGTSSVWDDASCGMFEDLVHCAQWKLLDARVVSRSSSSHTQHAFPLVELYDSSEAQTVNIGQELIRRGCAATPAMSLDVQPPQTPSQQEAASSQSQEASSSQSQEYTALMQSLEASPPNTLDASNGSVSL